MRYTTKTSQTIIFSYTAVLAVQSLQYFYNGFTLSISTDYILQKHVVVNVTNDRKVQTDSKKYISTNDEFIRQGFLSTIYTEGVKEVGMHLLIIFHCIDEVELIAKDIKTTAIQFLEMQYIYLLLQEQK